MYNKFYNTICNLIKSQLYTISLYARQLAGTVVLFVIARYLSVHDYGLFTSYKSIAIFCLMFTNLEYANYVLVSSKANVHQVKLKTAIFVLNALMIVALIAFLSRYFNLESNLIFILVTIRTFFDTTFFALMLPYFQAAKKFNIISIINIIYAMFIALIAVISYIFELSLVKFLILNILLGAINFLHCSYYIKINYFSVLLRIKDYIKMLDKSIFGYAGSMLTEYLYTQTSSLYVALFIIKEDAALYFSAATISSVIGLINSAQIQKMLPELIKANLEETKMILKKNLKMILFILSIVFVFFVFFGKYVLLILYGQQYYLNAYPILLIYIIAYIFIANGAIWGVYLTAINKQSVKAQMKIEASIVTILFLFLLHNYGIMGAIISFLAASIYVSLRFTLTSLKYLKNNITGINRS